MSLKSRRDAVVLALGNALVRWFAVEFEVVSVFAAANNLPMERACAIAAKFTGFASILDLADASVRSRYQETPIIDHWNSITEYVRELSGDRNNMAHSPLMMLGAGHPDTVPEDEVTVTVGPSPILALANSAKRALGLEELHELALDFSEARQVLADFKAHLAAGAPLLDKFERPIARRRPPRAQRPESTPQPLKNLRRPSKASPPSGSRKPPPNS